MTDVDIGQIYFAFGIRLSGVGIDFDVLPVQCRSNLLFCQIMFRREEYDILDKRIKLLLHQGDIEPTYHSSPEARKVARVDKLLKPVYAVLKKTAGLRNSSKRLIRL